MIDQWYFAWGENRFGPFSAEQLKELAVLGRLQPTDTVWKEGVEKGVLAERVKHLFSTPHVKVPSVGASAPLAHELSTPPERPNDLRSQTRNRLAKLDPWVDSTDDARAPDEQQQDIVPNDLMLEGIAGQEDSAILVSDSPVSSSEPEMIEGGEPEGAAATPQSEMKTPKKPEKKGRATALKGAVIINQDGATVQYRKKCSKCGHEDACRTSMPIRNMVIKSSFFCRKCRKTGEVVIRCAI
jgi:hypothetical protein